MAKYKKVDTDLKFVDREKEVEKFNLNEIYNYKLEESLVEKINDKDLVKNINIDECRFFKLNEFCRFSIFDI